MSYDAGPDRGGEGRRGALLIAGVRRTARRFREDWRALPDAARRRFLWTLAIGLGVSAGVMLGLCFVTRGLEEEGRLAWEGVLLRRLDRSDAMSFSTALWAESPGNSVFMIPVVLAAALVCVWLRRPLRALAVLAAFFMLDLVVLLGWLAWSRARPVAVAGGIASPGFHSFPSGHVAQIVAAYGFFVYLWLRASRSFWEQTLAVALFLGVLGSVALARLRLGSHWPSDILAGAAVGALWLAVVTAALRRAEDAGGR
ncbi:MAG TPA: phosphatase PAP2 family protein [Longimicrobium sp.]|jgi:undecaprenyl-diphosphatase